MKTEILSFLHNHWPEISVLVYEVIARLLPTSKNLSLLDLILKLTGKTLELTQKGADKVIPNRQKNTIKSFLVFALLSLSIGANAQLNLRAKSLYLTDNIAAKDTLANANDGQLYFNDVTQTLRLHKNGAWTTLSAGTISGLTNAINGLNVMGSNAELGGALIRNTTISGAFQLDFTNNRVAYDDQNLSIHNPARTFHYTFRTGAIAANRQITLPLLTSNETMVTDAFAQTLTNKTLGSGTVHSVSPTISSGAKFTFTPVLAGAAGINVGSVAGDVAAPVLGDLWYNSSTSAYMSRGSLGNRAVLVGNLTFGRVPYANGANGQMADDPGFTFNTAGDVLTTGRLVSLSTATLPGVNVGSFAGDPGTLVNGDLWYNSTSNTLRARINGTSRSWVVNTAANNEIPKSDGTGIVSTGIFSTSSGNLDLGSASTAGGNRIINAVSSAANANLDLITQGSGDFTVTSNGALFTSSSIQLNSPTVSGNDFNISASTGTLLQSKSASAGNGIPLNIQSASGFAGAGNDLDAENLRITGGDGDTNGDGGDIIIRPGVGNGTGINGNFGILDGADKPMGVATLVAGTVTVNNELITANTRVFLTVQTAGGTQGFLSVTRVAGTSFTITSTSATETSTVAWLLVEPN